MRRKKKKNAPFNSFIDVMTCLAGALVLIILLVITQIQEVKVVIPTPMEHKSSKKPVFIECRNGRQEMLTFIVRDDSFFVFKTARALAWVNDIDASWFLLPHDVPLKFGMQGESPMAQ